MSSCISQSQESFVNMGGNLDFQSGVHSVEESKCILKTYYKKHKISFDSVDS